jgi:HlyD family secretion protein
VIARLRDRRLIVAALALVLLALLGHAITRSGPLAPVPVTVIAIESQPLAPALFGIGTVEAQQTHRVGPTAAGRLSRVEVDVGDRVSRGQLLAEIDAVDFGPRLQALQAAARRAAAQHAEAAARAGHADQRAQRYEQLWPNGAVSAEMLAAQQQERATSAAAVAAAAQEQARIAAEQAALQAQAEQLQLRAPIDGLVIARHADPGSTVLAGQPVIELVDPAELWVKARFDQAGSHGLAPDLATRIVLRSRPTQPLAGHTRRIEPVADSVTEERLARIGFDRLPEPLPAIGELAELTVALPTLPAAPLVPNAALHRRAGQLGVWRISDRAIEFVAVEAGAADLDGRVRILAGLAAGDRVVLHSSRALDGRRRVVEVEQLSTASR